jgi:hypothetical protein
MLWSLGEPAADPPPQHGRLRPVGVAGRHPSDGECPRDSDQARTHQRRPEARTPHPRGLSRPATPGHRGRTRGPEWLKASRSIERARSLEYHRYELRETA